MGVLSVKVLQIRQSSAWKAIEAEVPKFSRDFCKFVLRLDFDTSSVEGLVDVSRDLRRTALTNQIVSSDFLNDLREPYACELTLRQIIDVQNVCIFWGNSKLHK